MDKMAPMYRACAWGSMFLHVIAGLWLTYRAVAATWFVDSDVVDLAVLRDGVARHGLRFLTTWIYTTDNWLFSVLPAYALVYAVIGDSPKVLVMSGWVIFVLCAVLTALLSARLTGRKSVGAAILALTVCTNYLVIGPAGLLGHPVTHNSSFAWCLSGWLMAWRGLRLHTLSWMAGACLAGLLVGLSDPWAMAAFILPALLSSMAMTILAPQNVRSFFAWSSLFWLLTALLARTRMLHVLYFLNGYPLQRPDIHTLGENFVWTMRSIGLAFGLLPGHELTSGLATGTALAAVTFVASWSLLRLLARWRTFTGAQTWMALCLVLSMLGTAAGAVIGPSPAGFSVLHFLINIYFLAPVLMAISACWVPSTNVARMVVAWGAMVALTGLLDNAAALRSVEQGDTSPARAVKPLTEFLERANLTYGYGPYWGAQANAITWYSRGRVTVRAVRFDPQTGEVSGQHEQTSRLWSTPGDIPLNQSSFFLILGNDGEICPDPARCEAAAIEQWGPPERRLTTTGLRGDLVILVWPHRLYSAGTLVDDQHEPLLLRGE